MTIEPKSYRPIVETYDAVRWDGTPEHAHEVIEWVKANGRDVEVWYTRDGYGHIRVKYGSGRIASAYSYTEGDSYEEGGDWFLISEMGTVTILEHPIFLKRYRRVLSEDEMSGL